jgi:hypothetical protein
MINFLDLEIHKLIHIWWQIFIKNGTILFPTRISLGQISILVKFEFIRYRMDDESRYVKRQI